MLAAVLVACGTSHGAGSGRLGRDGGLADAGNGTDADAGGDAGTPCDGGQADAGTPTPLTLFDGAELSRPPELVTPAQGLSPGVTDASHDFGGNLWAVSASRLFLKRAGLGGVESWGSGSGLKGDELLGVGGAAAGVAWVGYRGEGDSDDDPEWMWWTGGVGKVVLDGADIDVKNLSLYSPPGMYSQYPGGRHKLRTCYRVYPVKVGPHAGDQWFGCNHGMALVYGPNDRVLEHHHPGYCEWHVDTQSCTLHTGDVAALAIAADQDVWFGGSYGVGLLDYDQNGQPNFWGPEPVHNQPLWAQPLDPNQYGSEDVVGLAVAGDGSLWAASAHSGLAHRLGDGTVQLYQEAQGLPSNELLDVAADGANGLWLATTTRGVWRLDLGTGELRKAGGLPSDQAYRVVYEPTQAGPMLTVTVKGGVAVYPGTGAP